MSAPNPVPLQSVLLFQHHQTTTPFSPGSPVVASTVAEPKQKQLPKEEEDEEENEDEEEQDDEEH